MKNKQDQYREYVIDKLLCGTHIQMKIDTHRDNNRFVEETYNRKKVITITTSFNSGFTVVDEDPTMFLSSNGPVKGFIKLMENYGVLGEEVIDIWGKYCKMVGRMIDVREEEQKVL